MKFEDKKSANIYVHINNEKILSSGITITEFIKYNNKDISNILLLDSEILGNEENIKYKFELIEGKEAIFNILNDNEIKFGSLSFIDYTNKENINNLTKEEVMHMLYFAHCREKLKYLINNKIQNNYAYYCHDNDWYIEIVYKDIKDYIITLLNVLLARINIHKYKVHNIETFINILEKGVVFQNSNNKIKIYEVGELTDIDDIFNRSEELMCSSNCKHEININNNIVKIMKSNII